MASDALCRRHALVAKCQFEVRDRDTSGTVHGAKKMGSPASLEVYNADQAFSGEFVESTGDSSLVGAIGVNDDYLDKVASFVQETQLDRLPSAVLGAARDVVLDTLGAVLAGHRLSENRALVRMLAPRAPGSAAVLGTAYRVDPMFATFLNSVAGISLEIDEGNRVGAGHPAIHTLPGALAVAEEMALPGARFLEAFVVGYEIETRFGKATRLRPGVHSHGHWGAVGTAAAIAHLKRLNVDGTKSVLNIAASMSPANTWSACFEGATVRHLYSGRSGLQGILAHYALEAGFTGMNDAPSDIYGTILGEEFDKGIAVDGLGQSPFRIEQNYFKFHHCCRIGHPALDAVQDAASGLSYTPEEIDRVSIFIPIPFEGTHLARMLGPYPRNMLSAKFNIPYAVAALLVRGDASLASFYPEAIADERIRRLAALVEVHVDRNLATEWDRDGRPIARAEIHCAGGAVASGETLIVRGEWGNRGDPDALADKFLSVTRDVLSEEGALEVMKVVDRLETLPDIRELTALLSV